MTTTSTLTGWALVNALNAEIDDVFAQAAKSRPAKGTPEFDALVARLVAARAVHADAISAAWARKEVAA